MFYVVVATAIITLVAVLVQRWLFKRVLVRIGMSCCRKCGELLGPQQFDTFDTYPGPNLHFRIICGNCGTRCIYDQWGEFERDKPSNVADARLNFKLNNYPQNLQKGENQFLN